MLMNSDAELRNTLLTTLLNIATHRDVAVITQSDNADGSLDQASHREFQHHGMH